MTRDPARHALLTALLARDRAAEARIAALATLTHEELDQDDADLLLGLAVAEPDVRVRLAILTVVAGIAVTVISDRHAHATAWWAILASEPDAAVRRLALARLIEAELCRGNDDAARLAAVLDDLEPEVRALALDGLCQVAAIPAAVADAVAARAAFVSDDEAMLLLRLARQTPAAAGQRVAAVLLAPWRPNAVRAAAAVLLRTSARIEPGNQALLHDVLSDVDDAETLAWVVAVLDSVSGLDDEILVTVVDRLAGTAQRTAGLTLLRQRLDQAAHLIERIEAAVLTSQRATVWLAALDLLADSGRFILMLAALTQPSSAVRAAALTQIEGLAVPPWAELTARLPAHLAIEPIATLRRQQARLLARAPMLAAAEGTLIVAHLANERDAVVRQELVQALLHWRVDDAAGRAGRLDAVTEALRDPTTPAALRSELIAYLHRVAVEEPSADVASVLLVLLDQVEDIEDIEELDRLVRSLHPDPAQHAASMHALLRRYYHVFPQEPLTRWIRDTSSAVAAGHLDLSALIEAVRLTGAVWALPPAAFAADRDLLLWGVRRAVLAEKALDGERAIREAYEQRAIRRRDLVGIVRLTTFVPHFDHLAVRAIEIAKSEGVCSEDMLAAVWPVLCYQPRDNVAHKVVEWLSPIAAAGDRALLARLRATATPAWHRVAVLTNTQGDYTGSPWPIFVLLHAAGPTGIAPLFTDVAPDVEFHGGLVEAMTYLRHNGRRVVMGLDFTIVAGAFWRFLQGRAEFAQVRDQIADYLTGNRLGASRRHTSHELRFQAWAAAVKGIGAEWDPDLGLLGAELYLDQCRRLEPTPGEDPPVLPPMPDVVDEAHVAAQWPYQVAVPQRLR